MTTCNFLLYDPFTEIKIIHSNDQVLYLQLSKNGKDVDVDHDDMLC